MILSSWNIRGLNDPLKQQEVLNFLLGHHVDCGAVLETHIKRDKASQIAKKIFSNFSRLDNYDEHYNGRIWILWNPRTVLANILAVGAQFLHLSLLHLVTGKVYYITVVYAFNVASDRRDLWRALEQLSGSVDGPWVCMGDFNVVLNSGERKGSIHQNLAEMKEFSDCLDECQLVDHPATGCFYTWSNKAERMAKLDRAVVNQAWIGSVSSTVSFLPAGVSDLTPILLDIPNDVSISRPFKYLNCWSSSVAFHHQVTLVWGKQYYGRRINILFQKLRALRAPLKQLHKDSFSHLDRRVTEARNALLACQSSILQTGETTGSFSEKRSSLDDFKCLGAA
ncbi:uncharacterized protein LOC141627532 [Silene latifolia]|uniref:uncharacterized protein LOC141627532 n=1 Tax=Silene latifolia TaxID=37657 RepID=UPI003D76ABE8